MVRPLPHPSFRGGHQKVEEKKAEDEVLDDFFFEMRGPTVPAQMLWATSVRCKYQWRCKCYVGSSVTIDGKKVGNMMVGNLGIGRAKDSHPSDVLQF